MNEKIFSFWHLYNPKLPFNLLMTGISYCDKNYRIERNGENILSFEYIIDGSGVLEINGTKCFPQKNDVYILTKNSRHCYYSSEDDPWVKIWVVFNGEFAEDMFRSYIPPETYHITNCNILSYMKEIIYLASQKNISYIQLADEVSVIVHRIILQIKNHIENKPLSIPEQIKLYLDLNIENIVDISDISRLLGYSKNYIIKLFKDHYGITPYNYFRQHKIELAKQYLLNSSLNISEISEKLHFADQHYFANCFKSIVGVSPSQFRKNNSSHFL